MASDISNIIQNELINTFESLLSIEASVDDIAFSSKSDIESEQCIKVAVNIDSSSINASWNFYLPTLIATKFEYFILGGIGDLKASIDDEIVDATKEIISTIAGSMSTSINAQGFDDLSKFQASVGSADIIQGDQIGNYDNLYKIVLTFSGETIGFFIQFDESTLPYLGKIVSGEEIPVEEETTASETASEGLANHPILSLLGEESTDNLKLLFDIQLKFSVRLGTKTFLLKDIVNWDIGQIIELEQMVNEPLDILINGTKVGVGEAVIVEGRFGVKIKHIGEEKLEL
ncbi:MAG TPA: flagellar motor switch protein FliY [Arcobacter sp.]|nr:flagellar motor switch protein FliY [Arcobacter sp.]HIP55981.1 flagellar motor switch protein FliY [Arcobacter sp.]